MMRLLPFLLLYLPLSTHAQCPADDLNHAPTPELQQITEVRASFEADMTSPEQATCLYRLLMFESKLAFATENLETLEASADHLLGLDPVDSWGMLFKQYIARQRGEIPNDWESIERMPSGSIDELFVRKLSERLSERE